MGSNLALQSTSTWQVTTCDQTSLPYSVCNISIQMCCHSYPVDSSLLTACLLCKKIKEEHFLCLGNKAIELGTWENLNNTDNGYLLASSRQTKTMFDPLVIYKILRHFVLQLRWLNWFAIDDVLPLMLNCGPGQTCICTVVRMWPHVVQTTSKTCWVIRSQMHPECVQTYIKSCPLVIWSVRMHVSAYQ